MRRGLRLSSRHTSTGLLRQRALLYSGDFLLRSARQQMTWLTHLISGAYHFRLAFTAWVVPGSRRRIVEV